MSSPFPVTKKTTREASPDNCTYCHAKVGSKHDIGCSLIYKKVRLRAVITYEAAVPFLWDKDQIEFHRNESSWCKSNIIEDVVEPAFLQE